MREAISLDLGPLTRIMPMDPVPGGVAMAAIVSSKINNLPKSQILGEEEGDDRSESYEERALAGSE
jgi:hypothetical protein